MQTANELASLKSGGRDIGSIDVATDKVGGNAIALHR
jgi:hypothetical protein